MEPEIHVPLKRKQYLNQTSSDFGFKKFIFQGFSVFFFEIPQSKNVILILLLTGILDGGVVYATDSIQFCLR